MQQGSGTSLHSYQNTRMPMTIQIRLQEKSRRLLQVDRGDSEPRLEQSPGEADEEPHYQLNDNANNTNNNNNNTKNNEDDLISEIDEDADSWDDNRYYYWRNYFRGGSPWSFLRWLAQGNVSERIGKQSDEEIQVNLLCLARLLRLLRLYYQEYGMPELGGPKDQEFVLREVTRDLYAGGAPIWVLAPVMERAAEGLTGKKGVEFFLLPRKAFLFAPSSGATVLFKIQRGFDMQRLTLMERTLVRLASFASNTHGVTSLPTRLPTTNELDEAERTEHTMVTSEELLIPSKEELAQQILELGSQAEGLFFFVNSQDRPDTKEQVSVDDSDNPLQSETLLHKEDSTAADTKTVASSASQTAAAVKKKKQTLLDNADKFWFIEDEICQVFSRLACQEAIASIDKNDKQLRSLYSKAWQHMFRFLSSFGAAAFWFSGSWIDATLAGLCGVLVGVMSTWNVYSREERIIFETIASFMVGLISGFVAFAWPKETCISAIALGGVLDILQGFRVVYSIIELLSKHTVTGGADFLEGIVFTGLIAYFLRLGQIVAATIVGLPGDHSYQTCSKPVEEYWYPLLVPVASVAWSALFNPEYQDLGWMGFHGVLAFAVSWGLGKSSINSDFNLFLSAVAVTFSAGMVSRFTGRQAMGNTVAGLYVLLPGAYLVRQLFDIENNSLEFLGEIFYSASVIGLGAWSGTLLCSPLLLGMTGGQAARGNSLNRGTNLYGANSVRREETVKKNGTGAMLFF